jgi:hypothetical protein
MKLGDPGEVNVYVHVPTLVAAEGGPLPAGTSWLNLIEWWFAELFGDGSSEARSTVWVS